MKFSTIVIRSCIVNNFQTDAMVQTDTQYSSKGCQIKVATIGKCLYLFSILSIGIN